MLSFAVVAVVVVVVVVVIAERFGSAAVGEVAVAEVAEAEEVIRRGWLLSLSGIVTFKKSEELRRVAELVPLKQLLIETDAPYLAPQSRRGKRNESSYLPETASLIAKIKEIPVEKLRDQTTKNAKEIFRFSLSK